MKNLNAPVLLRLFILLNCLATWLIAFYSTKSLMYGMAHETNWLGFISLAVLLPLFVMGMIDLVINDLFPTRFYIKTALRNRHYLYMILSICFGITIFNIVLYRIDIATIPFFGIQVVFIPLAAIDDVILRYSQRQCPPCIKEVLQ